MRDISEFSCINPQCPDYRKRGHGNIRVQQTYGKNNPIRLLQCKTCGKRFSERSHTALSESRLPLEKALSVLEHLAEGCGIRKTGRLVGVSKDTVSRLHRIPGSHAKALHDGLVRDLAIDEVQFDEKWGFVGKKRETSQPTGEGLRQ
jgi:transposase-like protein